MTITFGIVGFHNCDGCTQKVTSALRKTGVELVQLNRETGNVTVSSSENREVIRSALERHLKKSVVVLSRDLVPANRTTSSSSVLSRHVRANQTVDIREMSQAAVLRLAQEFDGVEIRTTNTVRVNFIHKESQRVVKGEHHSRHHVESGNREMQAVVRQEHRGNSGVNAHDHRHHRHHGESHNRETRVETRRDVSEHTHRHHHHRHHGESQNRETRHEPRGNVGDNQHRHRHHSHHGESENRRRH